jgi:hypothetical protein
MKPSSNDDAESTIINPFYAILLKEDLFDDHQLEGAKEDWALKNAQLIEEIGSRNWLNELILALSPGNKLDQVRDSIISPYTAILFSPRLKGEHEPLISREQWINANVKLMKELGTSAWLWQLLAVLETGGPRDQA